MPYQALVRFIAGGKVNAAPERCPALEPAKVHVKQYWARGSADHGQPIGYQVLVVTKYTAEKLLPAAIVVGNKATFAPAGQTRFNAVSVPLE